MNVIMYIMMYNERYYLSVYQVFWIFMALKYNLYTYRLVNIY